MNISILNLKNINKINSPFFYFGNSFKIFSIIKKKTNYFSISYKGQLSNIAKKEELFFLKWIEKKRRINKDSIYWWMNQIAGRNNQSSNLFLYICQYLYIIKFLKKKKFKDICIICDNYYLQSFLYQNLKNKYNCKNSFNFFYFLMERLCLSAVKFLNFLKGIGKIFIQIFYSLWTRPANLQKPSRDTLLFHHCIGSKTKKINLKNLCNYYLDLPNLIKKKKNVLVTSLFWTYSGFLKLSFFKSMREHNSFIPEDWLGPIDYLKILIDMRKINSSLKKRINYNKKIDLDYLIDLEIAEQNNISSFRFLMYLPALKQWSKNLKKLVIFDQYQNMVYEHSLRFVAKNLKTDVKTIGYHHSLVSSGLLVYRGLKKEWKSNTRPDKVLTIGKLGKKLLIDGGIPKKLITESFSLRQVKYKKNHKIKRNKNILLILPLKKELALEICEKVKSINDELISLNFQIIVKTHPLLEKEEILKYLAWKLSPKNWRWENKDLSAGLSKCYLVLTSSSAAVYDAIVRGNIPIVLNSDFTTMNNYLDFFNFKSQNETKLPKLLDELYRKNLPYHLSIKRIRAKLIKGINSRSSNQENKMLNHIV